MNKIRLRSYIYLILVALIWGAAAPIIKFTLEGIDPLPFMSYRLAIASVFSLIFFIVKIKRGKKFKRLRAHLPLAITYGFLAVPLSLGFLFLALDKTTVLDLTLTGVIAPMIVMAGGALFYRDHITHKEKVGISIVLLGVILNSIYPLLSGGSDIILTGNFLLILYLLADSGSILLSKQAVRYKIQSSNLTNLAFIVGALTLIPLTIVIYGGQNLLNSLLNLPFKYHLGVWYMALMSGNLAYYLFVRGQRSIEVSEAVLFGYLQPLFTIPLAVFWLGETLRTSFILGAVIIAIGLFVAEYKRQTKKVAGASN